MHCRPDYRRLIGGEVLTYSPMYLYGARFSAFQKDQQLYIGLLFYFRSHFSILRQHSPNLEWPCTRRIPKTYTETIKGYFTICYMPILVKTVIARGSGPTEGSCRVVAGRAMAGSTTVSNGPVTWVVRRGRVSGVCRWSQAAGMP